MIIAEKAVTAMLLCKLRVTKYKVLVFKRMNQHTRKSLIRVFCGLMGAVVLGGCVMGCGKKEGMMGSGSSSAGEIPGAAEEVQVPQGITVGGEYIASDDGKFVMRGNGYVVSYGCDGNYIYSCTAYADMGSVEVAEKAVPVYQSRLAGAQSVTNVENYLIVSFGPEKFELLNREMLETLFADQKISY